MGVIKVASIQHSMHYIYCVYKAYFIIHCTAHSSGTNKTQFTQNAPNKVIFTGLSKKMYAQVNTH